MSHDSETSSWRLSHAATAKEALRLAFEDGRLLDLTFEQWWLLVEGQLNTGDFLTIQRLGAVYSLMQKAAMRDFTDELK